MSDSCAVRSYDYVNRPYAQVRDTLTKNALVVFQSATKAAASRADSLAGLRVDLGGIAVEAEIHISITSITENVEPGSTPVTHIELEWEAAKRPGLFPLMKADLSIYPLTPSETQLDFSGEYEPPLGAIGKAVNAIAGRRIAEVSVHRFVTDVAEYLRRTIG